MPAKENRFKAALTAEGPPLIGLWLSLASPALAEIAAGAGFDWLVVDGEHAPNDIPTILAQLQALRGFDAHPVVRVPIGERRLIKQVLDLGAQTVLVPMVESAEEARELVRSMRYPPDGARGVAGFVRAAEYGRIGDYVTTASAQTCLIVQVESRAALDALDDIAGVEGVDGVFIGPADLSADLGHPGEIGAPAVQAAIAEAIGRIRAAGKAAGILATDRDFAARTMELGARFVAVGADVALIADATARLRDAWR